ncbi:MAG: hypothetical protein Q4F72_09180, partial [Desulfovibrionaceae bacterium]|nr:hypothetical protein [Desulfovibrionaceae bacterium]
RCLLSDRGSSADAARYLRTSAQAGAPGEACGTGLMLVMRHLERDGKGYPALLPENPRFLQTARAGAKGKTPPQKERDDRPAMSFRSGLELLQAASASGSREAGVHLAMLRLIGADGMGGADGRQDGLAMLEAECARDNPPAFGALAGVLLQGLHGVARQPERGLALALQGFARRDPRSSALICLLRLGHLRPFPAAPGAAQNALPDSIRQLPVTSVEASGLLLWLACRRERLAQLAAQLWSSRSGAPSAEGRDLLDGRGLSAPMVRVLTRALNEADTGPAALLETFLADNAGSAGQPDGSQERNRDRSRDRSGNGARARANAAAETRDLSPAAIAALCALYRTDCRAALRRKTYDAPRFLDFAAAHAQGSI